MPFVDNRQTSPDEKNTQTGPLELPGLVSQMSPVEQLSFPEDTSSSKNTPVPPVYEAPASPIQTRALENAQSPNVTRMLPSNPTTDNLPNQRVTTNLRGPVVIRPTGKKRTVSIRPPRGRRMVIHVAVTALLACIVLGTLIAVIPVGGEAHGGFQLFEPLNKMFNTKGNTVTLIAAQAATATAVTQDGYDPGNYQSVYVGVPPPPADASSGGFNRFYYGQCTWWASNRYHDLTGKWIPWLGNAYEWYYGAKSSGWTVSATPHVPSIMVMMPGVQGASYGYGHVAVVEQVLGGGQVMTSNFNWGFGNWGVRTNQVFSQGSGVWFLSYPGM